MKAESRKAMCTKMAIVRAETILEQPTIAKRIAKLYRDGASVLELAEKYPEETQLFLSRDIAKSTIRQVTKELIPDSERARLRKQHKSDGAAKGSKGDKGWATYRKGTGIFKRKNLYENVAHIPLFDEELSETDFIFRMREHGHAWAGITCMANEFYGQFRPSRKAYHLRQHHYKRRRKLNETIP
ncbi:MAG: hypothetical protein ISS36_04305 [Candidatus Aenigmarchaeota archaeon]|nr:hypothetical protein [Candidatus Aenigmarchaeota archaeon]